MAGVIERLKEWGGTAAVEVIGREENVTFGRPPELRNAPRAEALLRRV